ncbi:MAG: hypothetical protein ACTSRG_23435 [Candidatus Helarchaeota archaeon]
MDIIKKNFQKYINDIAIQYDKDLPSCYFRHLCKYCSKFQQENFCFFKNNRSRANLRNESCRKCISFRDCIKAIDGDLLPSEIPTFKNHLQKLRNIGKPLNSFNQTYYPIIEIDSPKIIKESISLIKELEIEAIMVNPNKNMTINKHNLLRPGANQPFHDLLNFDGEIIMSTNFNDKYCHLILKDINRFKEMIEVLQPDVITTLDANFYYDQPNFITAIQLNKIFNANNDLNDLKQKMIGLVPPANSPYFEIGLLTQLAIGHKTIAIPLQELNAKNTDKNKKYVKRIIDKTLTLQEKFNFKFILLSTSPRNQIFSDAFSSFTWAMVKRRDSEVIKHRLQKRRLNKYMEVAKKQSLLKRELLQIRRNNLLRWFKWELDRNVKEEALIKNIQFQS